MSIAPAALLDSLSALSDPTRCRMLLLLEEQELTVAALMQERSFGRPFNRKPA